MRFWKPPSRIITTMQTMILSLIGKKMMALPRPEDVDVAEVNSEVAKEVVTAEDIEEMVASVEDIVEATMVVTVEGSEVAIVEGSEVATAVASEALEVATEVESVVCSCIYLIVTCN